MSSQLPTESSTGLARLRRAPIASSVWRRVAAAELVLGALVVVWDRGIPTLVLLAMAALSLTARGRGLGSLGLRRPSSVGRLSLLMLAFAVAWSLFQLSVTMPIANHVSGSEQDLRAFDDLQGNVGMLVGLLLLSWTLAAFGEELAYRGYLLTRGAEALGSGRGAVAVSVLVTSALFGLAHSEQGAIGVLVVSLDAVMFSLLRLRFRTLWAPILAHGFNNTLGFVAFFLVGPITGFW